MYVCYSRSLQELIAQYTFDEDDAEGPESSEMSDEDFDLHAEMDPSTSDDFIPEDSAGDNQPDESDVEDGMVSELDE